MIDTPEPVVARTPAVRHRRSYSTQLKSEVIQACLAPGATTRDVAQRYGLRRDLIGRWLLLHHRRTQSGKPKFVAWAPTPELRFADSSAKPGAPDHLRITCSNGDRQICLEWPMVAADQCARFLREWLQ